MPLSQVHCAGPLVLGEQRPCPDTHAHDDGQLGVGVTHTRLGGVPVCIAGPPICSTQICPDAQLQPLGGVVVHTHKPTTSLEGLQLPSLVGRQPHAEPLLTQLATGCSQAIGPPSFCTHTPPFGQAQPTPVEPPSPLWQAGSDVPWQTPAEQVPG
jgi:hypothetical protein